MVLEKEVMKPNSPSQQKSNTKYIVIMGYYGKQIQECIKYIRIMTVLGTVKKTDTDRCDVIPDPVILP